MPSRHLFARAAAATGSLALLTSTAGLSLPARPASAAPPTSLQITSASGSTDTTSTGLRSGAIKHVWLIILENKSYDATFTGLNKNSYLWKTLPQQGVLLKNYFGTGHFSQDNYESMVSGQAPEQDTQSDCDVAATDFSSNTLIENNGTLSSNPNFGQADSAAGPNAADGKNGCVYPSNVPTLFNQLDAAGKTWKGYAQDLGDQPGRDDGACGYPGTTGNAPTAALDTGTGTTHSGSTALNKPANYPGVRSFTGVQAAGNDAAGNPGAREDGYVAKHFPFPWFHSLLDSTTTPSDGGSDCDAKHIVNLDSQTGGLVHDLQSEATTPAFSWITPNNCSDAHDAVCKGNNLSGAFKADGSPDYTGVTPAYDPQGTTPTNYTGGLYASDLFLRWYVPLIEQSAAFKDGGLIDVTFDEANPPFSNSSFNNASDPAFAPDAANSDPAFTPDGGRVLPGVSDGATLKTFLAADAAGQNINGKDVNTEPAGPNTPLTFKADGKTPNPGPGDNAFIDRVPAGARTDGASSAVSASSANASVINDNSIGVADAGRQVSNETTAGASAGIPVGAPCPCFVGPVTDVGPQVVTKSVTATGGSLTPAASAVAGSFTLVDANGNPVSTTGPVTSVALSALTAVTDRLYDPTDFTPGGGDTGSVLISPFITPGSSSEVFYNHYSWLRSMEDIFSVDKGSATAALTPGAGSVSRGLDGMGHLGYAAQIGLTPFGPEVFNNPPPTPAPTVVDPPYLYGARTVGRLEKCLVGTWSDSSQFAFQWLRNGQPIAGATSAIYRVSASDYTHGVSCKVTATNASGSATARTAVFGPVAGTIAITRDPSLSGRPSIGQRLVLSGPGTSTTGVVRSFQWRRNGAGISGATGPSYVLVAADRGAKVTCQALLSAQGYRRTSDTTDPVVVA